MNLLYLYRKVVPAAIQFKLTRNRNRIELKFCVHIYMLLKAFSDCRHTSTANKLGPLLVCKYWESRERILQKAVELY